VAARTPDESRVQKYVERRPWTGLPACEPRPTCWQAPRQELPERAPRKKKSQGCETQRPFKYDRFRFSHFHFAHSHLPGERVFCLQGFPAHRGHLCSVSRSGHFPADSTRRRTRQRQTIPAPRASSADGPSDSGHRLDKLHSAIRLWTLILILFPCVLSTLSRLTQLCEA